MAIQLNHEELAARLARLERRNRMLWCAVTAAALLLLVTHPEVVPPANARPEKKARVIEAERFVVRDSENRERAVLTSAPAGGQFALFNKSGVPILAMLETKTGPMIRFIESQKVRDPLILGMFGGRPNLIMSEGEQNRVILNTKNGVPALILSSKEAGQAMLSFTNGKPQLLLVDKVTKPLFSAP